MSKQAIEKATFTPIGIRYNNSTGIFDAESRNLESLNRWLLHVEDGEATVSVDCPVTGAYQKWDKPSLAKVVGYDKDLEREYRDFLADIKRYGTDTDEEAISHLFVRRSDHCWYAESDGHCFILTRTTKSALETERQDARSASSRAEQLDPILHMIGSMLRDQKSGDASASNPKDFIVWKGHFFRGTETIDDWSHTPWTVLRDIWNTLRGGAKNDADFVEALLDSTGRTWPQTAKTTVYSCPDIQAMLKELECKSPTSR